MTDETKTDAELTEEYRLMELDHVKLTRRQQKWYLDNPKEKVPAAILAAHTALLKNSGRLGKAEAEADKDDAWVKMLGNLTDEQIAELRKIRDSVDAKG